MLREYKCGHPQWYAELLIACALDGLIQPTNNRNFDVLSSKYGRIQVKERVQGTDSTQNRSNFGRYEAEAFDVAAIILFSSGFVVEGAKLIRCADVLGLVRKAGHVKWKDVCEHQTTTDITHNVKRFE